MRRNYPEGRLGHVPQQRRRELGREDRPLLLRHRRSRWQRDQGQSDEDFICEIGPIRSRNDEEAKKGTAPHRFEIKARAFALPGDKTDSFFVAALEHLGASEEGEWRDLFVASVDASDDAAVSHLIDLCGTIPTEGNIKHA